ncbi:MAG: hypothetical protein K2P45_03905 [Eubacterium sp.]|nr:hypothetical protein [Eubacterium sp.]
MENVVFWMQNEMANDLFNKVFLVISAIISALLSSMVFYKNKNSILRVLGTSLLVYLGVVVLTLCMIFGIFRFVPQKESFWVLLKKIGEKNWAECLLPLAATLLSGIVINYAIRGRKIANVFFVLILACSSVISSSVFFWNSFQLVQRPRYAVPVEAISAIVNARLSAYPMEFSSVDLSWIDEIEEGVDMTFSRPDSESEDRTLPDNFTEFINCIVKDTYVPGMKDLDYLREAYELYSDGRHDNDYFCIGLMWYYLYSKDYFKGDDKEKCLSLALKAYKQYEDIDGGNNSLYNNMAVVYDLMNDRKSVRECMHKAMKCEMDGDDSDFSIVPIYKQYIYNWMDEDDPELLMDDAARIVEQEADLSMYILYGAYAADTNQNVKKAYQLLARADKHYKGKNVMIKILKCICADLAGINKSDELKDIYKLEKRAGGLTIDQETYLIRYLFATNRFDELWGYIAGVGAADNDPLDPEKVAIKSEWYFKNQDKLASDKENVESLLAKVNDELKKEPEEKTKNLLLLSQMLLRSCLGQEEPHNDEEYKVEGISDIKYVFLAVNAFNNEKYKESIDYCENFFELINAKKDKGSVQKLEPQEQVILCYQVQLILAHSHFEYAMELKKGSEEWNNHMKSAEAECNAFEQSSKSLYYIGEQFKMLKDSIDIQNNKISEDENAVVEV